MEVGGSQVKDFNGDGKSDGLWCTTTSENYIWYMNGVTRVGGSYLDTVAGRTWQITPQGYGSTSYCD